MAHACNGRSVYTAQYTCTLANTILARVLGLHIVCACVHGAKTRPKGRQNNHRCIIATGTCNLGGFLVSSVKERLGKVRE